MPLILAIESDADQAKRITAVVRRRLKAELVMAPTVGEALSAIGSRAPDLVLVPALLSPREETALMQTLRAAAPHVQLLTTPLLTEPSSRDSGRGLLSIFRRESGDDAAVGCHPAEFADQVSAYLRRVEEARAEPASEEAAAEAPPTSSNSWEAELRAAEGDLPPVAPAALRPREQERAAAGQSDAETDWTAVMESFGRAADGASA